MTFILKKDVTFIQAEDEIASICAIIGASLTGNKVMTATSGPGFSLMQEALGYAVMAEIPAREIDASRDRKRASGRDKRCFICICIIDF